LFRSPFVLESLSFLFHVFVCSFLELYLYTEKDACNKSSDPVSHFMIIVYMKTNTFWGVTSCNPVVVQLWFGDTNCLHLQGWSVSYASNQKDVGSKNNALLFTRTIQRTFQ
jgi:hypothetical protein